MKKISEFLKSETTINQVIKTPAKIKLIKPPTKSICKVVCYYSHDKMGNPIARDIVLKGGLRKEHPIYEYELFKGNWRVNHDAMIIKALRHVEIWNKNIISAMIILKSYKLKKEICIGFYKCTNGWEYWYCPSYISNGVDIKVDYKFWRVGLNCGFMTDFRYTTYETRK